MNRKTLSIIGIIALLVLALLTYFFLRKSSVDDPVESFPEECLVFQSDDSKKLCYRIPSVPISPNTPRDTVIIPTYPEATSTTSSTIVMPESCVASESTFERNDCVTKTAVSSKNSKFCSLIVGSLAQGACIREVGFPVSIELPKTNQSYEVFLRSINVLPTTSSIKPTQAASTTVTLPDVSKTNDPRFTVEGFVDRYSSVQPLSVFALSQYQVRPGEKVTLYGGGFVYPSSVHVGSLEFSGLKSDDGVSLSFTAPASSGEYEVWVTNSKGSSLSVSSPVKLLVTDNPLSPPSIISVSPTIARYDDMVTVTGSGFAAENTLSTTLGVIERIGASGNVIQFRVRDLPVASQVKDVEGVKGKKLSIGMHIGNTTGFNQQPFYFEVQF